MAYEITKKEQRQMVRWVLLGTGTFFIYFYLREVIMDMFPDKNIQLFVGIGLLLLAAKYFDLTKYGG